MTLFNDANIDLMENADGEPVGCCGHLKVCCVACREDLTGETLRFAADWREESLECSYCGESVVTL